MSERKYESTFIPCGDSFEKMDEIDDIFPSYEQEERNEENPEVND